MLHCRQRMSCATRRVAAGGCAALEAAGAALVAVEELHCTGDSGRLRCTAVAAAGGLRCIGGS